ncbi:MAG: hypothetical protein KGL39_16690 [Patescibacteria group bacterium]|nr:hypothetical protein [Patescibacteria group bacterium]
MGLLDVFNDDNARFALGLLAAAGPSNATFGQRVQEALGGVEASRDQRSKRALQEAQIADFQQQAKLREMQAKQAQQKQDMLAQWMGGPMSAEGALAAGAQQGSIGPTVANAQLMAGGGPMSKQTYGIPRDVIAADMALNEGKNTPGWLFKQAMPDMVFNNGVWTDKNKVQPGMAPGMHVTPEGQGVQWSVANGQPVMSAISGSPETYQAFQDIKNKSQAGTQLLPLGYVDTGTGKPIGGTTLDYIQGRQTAPQNAPIVNQGNAKLTPELMDLIRKDAAANGGHAPTININAPKAGQTMGLTQQPAKPGLMSEAEQKAAADVAAQIGNMAKDSKVQAQGAVKMFDAADRIERALDSNKVLSGPLASKIQTVKQFVQVVAGGDDEGIRQTRQVIKSLSQMSVEARKQLQGQGQVTDSEAAAVAKADGGDINNLTIGELRDLVTLTKRAANFTAKSHQEILNSMAENGAMKPQIPFFKVSGIEPALNHVPQLPQIGKAQGVDALVEKYRSK